MTTPHPQSLAAIRMELRDALADLSDAERYFKNAQRILQDAKRRADLAALASIAACEEIRAFMDLAPVKPPANAVHNKESPNAL